MDGKVTEFAEHGHYQQAHKCDYDESLAYLECWSM